jgi:large exoprotein involved in heme utilization and adhesion
VEINGVTPAGMTSAVISSIQPFADGQGGNITINTRRLALSNGGTVSNAVAGNGNAGNIEIRATEVEVSDPVIDSFSKIISGITASIGKNAGGSGGSINLAAERLRVFNGGQLISSTQGNGSAGNVNIQVKNIDVQGTSQNLINGSQITSAIAASSTTTFNAGTVNVISDSLRVRDRGEITVSNTGTGDAGNLNVAANKIFLDNKGSLRSEVKGGSQGNIRLQVNETLLLRHGSNITTNASDTSTGGNIDITAGSIIALPDEDSDIVANAVLGSGGNIQIATQGILGLKFRPQLTQESDITASSQFGVSGTVQINNIGVDPNSGLVELPQNVSDPSQKIATGCSANQGSSFVATGRGGIPQNPNQEVRNERTWSDIRDISTYRNSTAVTAQIPSLGMVQATGWHRNAKGKIELIADNSSTSIQSSLTCAAVPRS